MASPSSLPTSEFLRRQRPLDLLKAQGRQTPLPEREKHLLVVLALQALLLPWFLGGEAFGAQVLTLVLAGLAFFLALLPRKIASDLPEKPTYTVLAWPRLLRFPFFWCGLALLVHLGIHASQLASTSEETPAGHSPWQSLLPFLSAWLSVCAVWVGFTRRRPLLLLLTALCLNACVLAFLAIAQVLLGSNLLFAPFVEASSVLVGPFLQKGQAGAYFNLLVAFSSALAAYHFARTQRQMLKSTPAGVFLFLALTLAAGVLLSYSRPATLLLLGFTSLLVVALLLHRLRNPNSGNNPVVTGSVILILLGFVYVGVDALRLGQAWSQNQRSLPWEVREQRRNLISKAWVLFNERPWTGHGLDAFARLLPPESLHTEVKPPPPAGSLDLAPKPQLHQDFLQLSVDFGLLGWCLLSGCLVFAGLKLAQGAFWLHPPIWIGLLGLGLTALHSLNEALVGNLALLLTWCLGWPCFLRWLEFEDR